MLPEKRIRDGCAEIRRRAVVPQEAHADVLDGGERLRGRCVGEKLECHCRGVVWHAVEIGVLLRELSEAEEGLETAVGTELDVEFAFAGAGNGGVEGLEDLRGECGAGYGTDGGGAVVCEVPLVGICEGAGLGEGGGGEEGGGVDGRIVD